ncbi:hypothetical protein FQN54_001861 [Arachnomyces sp. PD_36]|nr:hypothetical protein FQN54_001861 [Arachnomyces sp. PD_36]
MPSRKSKDVTIKKKSEIDTPTSKTSRRTRVFKKTEIAEKRTIIFERVKKAWINCTRDKKSGVKLFDKFFDELMALQTVYHQYQEIQNETIKARHKLIVAAIAKSLVPPWNELSRDSTLNGGENYSVNRKRFEPNPSALPPARQPKHHHGAQSPAISDLSIEFCVHSTIGELRAINQAAGILHGSLAFLTHVKCDRSKEPQRSKIPSEPRDQQNEAKETRSEMSDIKKYTIAEPYLDIEGHLLEGPHYDEARNELRFVDIWHQKIHFVNLKEGPSSLRSLNFDVSIGVTADIEGSELLAVGAKHGFATVNHETGEFKYIKRVWNNEQDGEGREERMRFNDGAVDSRGRFWAGAMNDPKFAEVIDEGAMFRLDPDLKLHRVLEKIVIPNGIGWSDDEKTMYITDSPSGDIYAFDFDVESGNIANKRVFFHLGDGSGVPDGFAMDVEGCFWIAVHGGSKVIRVSPEAKVIAEISLPTRGITCPVFVGTELFITTAQDGEGDKFPDSARYGGRMFRVEVGVEGKPKHKFRLQ